MDFGFGIPGLWEWTSGFGWDLANVLKRRPYVVLVARILEFRQAEIFSGRKFGIDLRVQYKTGWAEIVSGWKVRLDLESKEDRDEKTGTETEVGGVSSEFGFRICGDSFGVSG